MSAKYNKSQPIRLGKIEYLNVLPIYYPLEKKIIANDFEILSGPPAKLNQFMSQGILDISAASSIEYARNYKQYLLVPDLAIGSFGSVQSVLLLSKYPFLQLEGKTILISSQTHTSAALLRVILAQHLQIKTHLETGDITAQIKANIFPSAFLAIGDEALKLRNHPAYPYKLDLGQAWLEWTKLPFIFGVWVVNQESIQNWAWDVKKGCRKLLQAKDWGIKRIDFFAETIATNGILDKTQLKSYFQGLSFDLRLREKEGLQCFYEHLRKAKEISELPPLAEFDLN